MSITATPQQSHSRDVALAAIAQAQSQIGHADGQLVQLDETAFKLEKEKNAARHPSNEQPRSAEPGRGSSRGRLVLRSLMGLLALACIGVAAFAWQSNHGQVASEPTSTSSVSIEKREQPAQPAPYNADVAAKTEVGLPQPSSQAQTTLQRAVSSSSDSRSNGSRSGAVDPNDSARTRKRGARDRSAQDGAGTNGPRQCRTSRASRSDAGNGSPQREPRRRSYGGAGTNGSPPGSKAEKLNASICFPLCLQQRTSLNSVGRSVSCQYRKSRALSDHLVAPGRKELEAPRCRAL